VIHHPHAVEIVIIGKANYIGQFAAKFGSGRIEERDLKTDTHD